jgi:hypothetical protein
VAAQDVASRAVLSSTELVNNTFACWCLYVSNGPDRTTGKVVWVSDCGSDAIDSI